MLPLITLNLQHGLKISRIWQVHYEQFSYDLRCGRRELTPEKTIGFSFVTNCLVVPGYVADVVGINKYTKDTLQKQIFVTMSVTTNCSTNFA